MFEPWQLAMIDEAGYNGIRDEHIDKIAESILSSADDQINDTIISRHCYKCGINPYNLDSNDIIKIKCKISFK